MYRFNLVALVLFSIIGMGFNSTSAVCFQDEPNESDELLVQDRKIRRLKQRKLAAELRFDNIIQELTRVCELDESQIKKLRVASKGAINVVLSKAKDRMIANAELEQTAFDLNAEISNENEKADRRVLRKYASKNVEREKLWVKSLKKVLSEEQAQKWQANLESRNSLQRQSVVLAFVANADEVLFLSRQQRDALIAVIDEEYGDSLVFEKEVKASFRRNGGFSMVAADIPEVPEPESIEAKVKEVLNDSQFEIWNVTVTQKFVRLKRIADELVLELGPDPNEEMDDEGLDEETDDDE